MEKTVLDWIMYIYDGNIEEFFDGEKYVIDIAHLSSAISNKFAFDLELSDEGRKAVNELRGITSNSNESE